MQKLAIKHMPGDPGLPGLGRIWQVVATEGFGLIDDYRRFGPVFRSRFLGRDAVVLIGAQANRAVLQDQAHKVSSYDGWGPFMEHIFGKPMMLQDGEVHRQTRRLMNPAFHTQAIVGYAETMRQILEANFARWIQQPNLPLHQECRKLALLVGIRLLLGVEADNRVEQIENWYNDLLAGATAVVRLESPFTTYGRACAAREKLRELLFQIIGQRRRDKNLASGRDSLGLFLTVGEDEAEAINDAQIVDELIHLVNGAHFTTATSLTWAIVELAARPNWCERLRQEVHSVVGNQRIGAHHLRGLVAIGWFLKEIERFYSPAGAVLFRGVRQPFEFEGYTIPPGWLVVVSPFVTHRLPNHFENPDRFDPERFAPPREEDRRDPYALVGFGAGPHVCIGKEFALMELKLALALLLSRYAWSVNPSEFAVTPKYFPARTRDRYKVTFRLL